MADITGVGAPWHEVLPMKECVIPSCLLSFCFLSGSKRWALPRDHRLKPRTSWTSETFSFLQVFCYCSGKFKSLHRYHFWWNNKEAEQREIVVFLSIIVFLMKIIILNILMCTVQEVKGICCSLKDLLGSQHPHGNTPALATSVPQNLMSSSGLWSPNMQAKHS